MARKIFKSGEVKDIGTRVLITPPEISKKRLEEHEPAEEAIEVAEHHEEPLKAAEQEVAPVPSFSEEEEKLLEEARRVKEDAETEAKRIKEEAETAAFQLIQKNSIDVKKLKETAQAEAEQIREEAEKRAAEIESETQQKLGSLLQETRTKAYDEGREEGFKQGEEEVKRLIERLHVILNAAIDKRNEIVASTERQVVDLILLIAHKVVHVISEQERKVVIENVKVALKKVKGETQVTIRVNTKDLDLTTKNKRKFIELVEGLENIRVEEDTRVGHGGCIIETSFGDIDARIQKQLHIIEEKIRELIPIKE